MKYIHMVNSVREKQKKGERKMGKYMRKSKGIGEVNHANAATQSSLGVRTRAKTLALQKSSPAAISGDDGSYLQLRSRRLVKTASPVVAEGKRRKHLTPKSGKGKVVPRNSEEEREEIGGVEIKLGAEENNQKDEKNDGDGEMEASFGENLLEFDDKERKNLGGKGLEDYSVDREL